ncbi:unnamed protein product, partial [Callosobruchus maculatus]
SVACLRAIRKLQKFGHLPSRPTLFKSYAQYGHFIDVRIAALECLVDFVRSDGKWEDLSHVLDILENDPDPGLKHKLASLLISNPPFKRAHRGRCDVPELVERIWGNINGMLSHDSRLRCDFVDLYYTLYGNKRPFCIPLAELSGIMNLTKFDPSTKKVPKLASTTNKQHQQQQLQQQQQSPALVSTTNTGNIVEIKKEQPELLRTTPPKETSAVPPPIILDTVECVNDVEIVASEIKSEVKEEVMDIEVGSPTVKQEYFSDNSVSLPGLGQVGPVGFEPGMFKNEDDRQKTASPGKVKKKKKDKKKHKHKHHKHKHSKDKEKKEKDPTKVKKEDTLSSMSSTPSPNTMSLGGAETI